MLMCLAFIQTVADFRASKWSLDHWHAGRFLAQHGHVWHASDSAQRAWQSDCSTLRTHCHAQTMQFTLCAVCRMARPTLQTCNCDSECCLTWGGHQQALVQCVRVARSLVHLLATWWEEPPLPQEQRLRLALLVAHHHQDHHCLGLQPEADHPGLPDKPQM